MLPRQTVILPVPNYDFEYLEVMKRLDPHIGSSTFLYWNVFNKLQGLQWTNQSCDWGRYVDGLLDTIPADVIMEDYKQFNPDIYNIDQYIIRDLEFIFNRLEQYYANLPALTAMRQILRPKNMYLDVESHVKTEQFEYIKTVVREV